MAPSLVHVIVSYSAHISEFNRKRLNTLILEKLRLISKNPTISTDAGIRKITAMLTTFDKDTLALIEQGLKGIDNSITITYNVLSGDWSRDS